MFSNTMGFDVVRWSRVRIFALTLAVAVAGCGSDRTPQIAQTSDDPSVALGARLGVLPPRDALEDGECAMFLWRRGTSRQRLVLHVSEGDERAVIALDGAARRASRVSAEGLPVLGQYRKQSFAYEDLTIDLTVAVEQRAGLIGGAVVSSGVLRLTNADGWSASFPVGGLIGCGA